MSERSLDSVHRAIKLAGGSMEGPVYIAGPMTGLPEYNFPAFRQAEVKLKDLYPGIEVENPIVNGEGNTDLPYEYYFRKGLEQLMRCKTIILLPGWASSRGAKLECEVAAVLNLEMWYLEDLERMDSR